MLFKKKTKAKQNKQTSTKKYKKMLLYFIVINYGYCDSVLKLLWENGSNAQSIAMGRGTARKEVLNMFGLENSNKDIILAFVDESNVKTIKKCLEKHFATNKRIMGFGFSVQLTSIVGEKIYHFLTNTL